MSLAKKKFSIPMYLTYYATEEVEAVNEDVAAEIAMQRIGKAGEKFSLDGQTPQIDVIWDDVTEI